MLSGKWRPFCLGLNVLRAVTGCMVYDPPIFGGFQTLYFSHNFLHISIIDWLLVIKIADISSTGLTEEMGLLGYDQT